MQIVDNKYGLEISVELVNKYYSNLINEFYKILPIYEGKDMKTKTIVYSEEEAYKQFQKYIENFTVELCGGFYLFNNDIQFLKLLNILEGLYKVNINEHEKVKKLVFHCISICKKNKIEEE